ncbi:hypothetical protein ABIC22_002468 [Paenibacillus sp. PvP094]
MIGHFVKNKSLYIHFGFKMITILDLIKPFENRNNSENSTNFKVEFHVKKIKYDHILYYYLSLVLACHELKRTL